MSEQAKPDKGKKEVTIIVNAQQKTVAKEELSFNDVVDLAFPGGPRGGNWVYTVAYRRAHGNKSGTLVEGESVSVKDGMIFDVTQTDKS